MLSLLTCVQDWTAERTQYLGTIIQRMLRSYTDTAVNLTTGLLAFISRFALQASSPSRQDAALQLWSSSICVLSCSI